MSFASRVTYTGDGVTKSYNVPFPYISISHVNIYVNQTLQLDPMNYSWTGPSTIQFTSAPAIDDAIEIVRNTSPSDELVDFTDGSVLRADDLDTAYLHNFYLSQEYSDSYNNAINNILIQLATDTGIVETETTAIIDALVQEMLADAAAANLQARISDIDANAEAIITLGEGLQTQINTLAEGVAANVYIQDDEPVPGVGGIPDPILEGSRWYDSDDNNAPYIYQSGAWVSIQDPRIGSAFAAANLNTVEMEGVKAALADEVFLRAQQDTAIGQTLDLLGVTAGDAQSFVLDLNTVKVGPTETIADRFTTLSAADSTNAAAILTEQTARIDGDNSLASDITSLTATVNGNTANITTNASAIASSEGDITTLYAKYGVTLSVNGYVTGFAQNNDGTSGNFVILADRFAVVDPSGDPGEPEYSPFTISGGKITLTGDVTVNGSLILNGTVVGSALVAGTIGSTQIGTDAITTDKINANAITSAKIAANQITATHIGVSTVSALGITTGSLSVDGTLTMGTTGQMISTGTGFESGTGFFLGYDTSAYKFYVGNVGTGNYMSWDGTDLTVSGIINVGEYIVDATKVQASAPTERSQGGYDTSSFYTKKTFTIDKPGDIRVYGDFKKDTNLNNSPYDPPDARVTKNGSLVAYFSGTTTSYAEKYVTVLGCEKGDVIDIDLQAGSYWNSGAGESFPITIYVKDAEIRADISFTGNPTVDLD